MTATSPYLNQPVRSEREAVLEAQVAELRAAIAELLAAEDAALAFRLNCHPFQIGQIEWLRQDRETSGRRLAAIAKARALADQRAKDTKP